MKKRVLVGMSGGVDSSVASFLLKQEGYEVVGVTMCLGIKDGNDEKPRCCGVQAIEDARRVCDKLRMPHYVMDFSKDLEEKVVNNFVSEYLRGRTPNPCVNCNRYIKFGTLLQKARALDFDFLATGHYAKIEKDGKEFILKTPKDKIKDQTYFLYPIKKDMLGFILFPLAGFTKKEVRSIASSKGLPVAQKPQSQDICFVPQSDYKKFILARIKDSKPGLILSSRGEVLGKHKGIIFYTIGQREGLGISSTEPLYVLSIDAERNQITVGPRDDLKAKGFLVADLNLLFDWLPQEAFVKIRYGHKQTKCNVCLQADNKLKVTFQQEQEAVTPGQSAVFYNNDSVLGGGVIEEVLRGYN